MDTLTGVSNRIVALRYLESELPYYRRHPNRSLHFLMMDMDHFKHINDEYGHLEGDAALVLLAGILKKVCANYNGVLARYGGDEFVLLLSHIPAEKFRSTLERIRGAVYTTEIPQYENIHPTVSIGGVYQAHPLIEAIRRADKLM